MLRPCVGFLVERSTFTLIEEDVVASRRVPRGRAVKTGPSTAGLRPSGRDDGGGRLQNRRVGRAARAMGFATEGTEGIRPQVGPVLSVILCGLSCPCVLFSLSVGVRLALGGMATQSVAMGRRTGPVHRQVMPTRAWACHPAPMGQGERGRATRPS